MTALLDIADVPLSRAEVTALLVRVHDYCERVGMASADMGRIAANHGGLIGLMRSRTSCRSWMAALLIDFMQRWPDGCPRSQWAGEQAAAVRAIRDARDEDARSRKRAMRHPCTESPMNLVIEHFDDAAPSGDGRAYAIGRDPCARCGVRGELGCAHQRPFVAPRVRVA